MSRSAFAHPRRLWVGVHRWAGLTTAFFLIIAGLTGMVLPFEEPLTFASRPSLSRALAPSSGARVLTGVQIAERVEKALGVTAPYVPLNISTDHVVRLFVTTRAGRAPLSYDVVWADPYTGEVRLTYRFGGVTDGAENIVPFLYALHYGFVAGPWGMFVFGVAALIWTVDCFIGFYLTLPVRQRLGDRRQLRRWWQQWWPAWRIRRSSRSKITFDLHRAGGLWLWPMLAVFAWSAVGLALPQVERPVMHVFGATDDFAPAPLPRPMPDPRIDRAEAVDIGSAELARIGHRRGFIVEQPSGLRYDPASGTYTLSALTTLDRADENGGTQIWIDGNSGAAQHFTPPMGESHADAFMQWLYMLHMAEVFGLPYRIAVTAMGGVVTTLSLTGIMIWSRRRGARSASARLHRAKSI